ncbi:D-cysteine desulfhydrase [Sporomusa malonica]|uniref:D-cysteine desulfhydrase n=1 Tax=Sporomusa malonica TaxID=112901 RepID=A0A1W2E017_9FIRM|nr:D-cysteine desulfhydrase [Sporomusa malonica]SMD02666.1 D-cysteine desulfhydrase [Sporomusa malonica]
MNLARFPRRRYTEGRTPLERLTRFSQAIGGPNIYIKRDDLLGLTGGGNKTRKLEFLVADALAQGADTVITCGGVQSNHCRLTLAAAVKEGLKCRLVLDEMVPGSYNPEANGNVFLYHLLGVEKVKVVPRGTDLMSELQSTAAEAVAEGRKPYIIPMGGSNYLGALGYIACAEEIMSQTFEAGLDIHHIVLPGGSAGTHSGLLLGLYANSCHIPVTGISVLNPKVVLENRISELMQQTAAYMKINVKVPSDAIVCVDEYLGPGYTLPTAEMIEAVKLLASTEGILLDPTYTGKAMAGLIGLAEQGFFKKNDNVLFLHTGGTPGLYANTPLFMS